MYYNYDTYLKVFRELGLETMVACHQIHIYHRDQLVLAIFGLDTNKLAYYSPTLWPLTNKPI